MKSPRRSLKRRRPAPPPTRASSAAGGAWRNGANSSSARAQSTRWFESYLTQDEPIDRNVIEIHRAGETSSAEAIVRA